SPVIRYPERTKKTSTPMNPPASHGTPAWAAITSRIATARRPSRSGRYLSPGSPSPMPGPVRRRGSPALGVAAVEAGQAVVEIDDGLGAALAAHHGLLGEGAFARAGTLRGFLALLGEVLLPVLVRRIVLEKTDALEVHLHHVPDLRHQRGHELAALLEVAAAGIEHAVQLFHQERDVAALAEHRRDDARQRHDPLEVVHVLRVDEDLEGAPELVLGAGIEHDVVDGDVKGVLRER